ncbi:MAG: TrbG/VirB9 family P-type conjugative transfer protein [Burkholderiaceae bacterium]|nr:TrbG/VirB9 family P-type conjugative transfer protein [Burkholderiaceae bacterium]
MQIHKILPVTCVLLALSVTAWAQNVRYDFDYRTTDQRVQVFDDGKVTRIQFPEGTPDPTIVAVEPKGEVLLKITKEAPHLIVNGIYSRLVMRWGNRREVQAVYNGVGADAGSERSGSAASFGTLEPQAKYGSVAKPVVVAHSQVAQQTTSRDNDVPGRTRAVVVEMPSAPATPVVVPEAVKVVAVASVQAIAPVAPVAAITSGLKRFTFQANDKTVEGAFTRWAEEAKLGKKVTWRVARKPPLDALGDFEAESAVVAMTMVAASFENSRNPFVVEEYDNVIVVVPRISARLQSK